MQVPCRAIRTDLAASAKEHWHAGLVARLGCQQYSNLPVPKPSGPNLLAAGMLPARERHAACRLPPDRWPRTVSLWALTSALALRGAPRRRGRRGGIHECCRLEAGLPVLCLDLGQSNSGSRRRSCPLPAILLPYSPGTLADAATLLRKAAGVFRWLSEEFLPRVQSGLGADR